MLAVPFPRQRPCRATGRASAGRKPRSEERPRARIGAESDSFQKAQRFLHRDHPSPRPGDDRQASQTEDAGQSEWARPARAMLCHRARKDIERRDRADARSRLRPRRSRGPWAAILARRMAVRTAAVRLCSTGVARMLTRDPIDADRSRQPPIPKSRLRRACERPPARKPRTECCCQPVALNYRRDGRAAWGCAASLLRACLLRARDCGPLRTTAADSSALALPGFGSVARWCGVVLPPFASLLSLVIGISFGSAAASRLPPPKPHLGH